MVVVEERLLGGLGEGEKGAQSRHWIENLSLSGFAQLQQAKAKSNRQIVHGTPPRGLRVTQQMTKQIETDESW